MAKWWKILGWLVYSVVIGWFSFAGDWWLFLIGNLIAVGLLMADKLIYAWWLFPYEQTSIQIQYWMRRRDVSALMGLLVSKNDSQTKLLLKSAGFALVWFFLTIYVLTSTGSVVALGILMGLGLNLSDAIVSDWKDLDKLGKWFGWQIKRPLGKTEVKVAALVTVLLWLGFNLRLLFSLG